MINSFPGYEYVSVGCWPKNQENIEAYEKAEADGHTLTNARRNMYHGEDVGFGGYVYAEPGIYPRTVTLDVSGMHPASILALNCLGDYTKITKR